MKRLAFLLLLSLDILTKIGALRWIPAWPSVGIPLFSFLGVSGSLTTVTNSGAAMGLFGGHATFLFVVRAAIILGLMVYLLFLQRDEARKIPLWLVVTGAIGNAIDYCAYGHVIDFVHLRFWGHSFPIFNLADCYITTGVSALLWLSRRPKAAAVS